MRSPFELMFPLMSHPLRWDSEDGEGGLTGRATDAPPPARRWTRHSHGRTKALRQMPLRRPRRRFVGDEVLRVSPIGDGPALAHHPGTDARAAHAARGDQASVAVAGPRLAGHGSPADVLGQRIRGRLAAPPWLATEVTQLAGLWRVDAVQSDTLPVHLDRVAVDDRGDADDVGSMCTRRDRRPRGC
jgi:hypothetical protein